MHKYDPAKSTADNLLATAGATLFTTILADPPWRFKRRTGALSPENPTRFRYPTMPLEEIKALPVGQRASKNAHLYLWIPCSMLPDGLAVMAAWGFKYKTTITWEKTQKNGVVSGAGFGHYFRNSAEFLLFGVKGKLNTVRPSGGICNVVRALTAGHSRKPAAFRNLIETASPGPYLELFARQAAPGWVVFGNQANGETINELVQPLLKRNCAHCGKDLETSCTPLECPNYYCSGECADTSYPHTAPVEEAACLETQKT